MFGTAEYDPEVIQEFADKLYAKAGTITLKATVLYGVCGAIAGSLAGHLAKLPDSTTVMPVVGAVFAGWIGYSIGSTKSFSLRLQAQIALCQMQIERNTQPSLVPDLQAGSRMDMLNAKRKALRHQKTQEREEDVTSL